MSNSKITAILIDDEPMAIRSMERMLAKYCPQVEVIGKTINPEEGITLINNNKPDLLFLDIAMPKMDGFSVLKQINDKDVKVIFITAYDEYALQAFKTAAADYLLKPVDKDELLVAVDKVTQLLESDTTQSYITNLFETLQKNNKNTSIGLPTMEGLDFVKTDSIIYCHSDGNYTEIFLEDKRKFLVTRKIKFMEEKLDPSQFIRVHNSYLINLNYVEKYIKGRGGTLVMSNGDSIPVSVRKKNDFLDAF